MSERPRPVDPALLRVLPEARRPVALLAGLGVAGGVLAVGQVVAVAVLVTTVVAHGPVLPAAAAVAGVVGLRGLVAALAEALAARAATTVSGALRRRVVAAELRRATAEPEPALTTQLAQGAASVEGYVVKYLPALASAAVLPALVVVVLALVDPWSAVAVVLTLPLLPLFAALIGQATQDATQRRWRALADLSGHFLDVLRGLPVLVAYGRGEAQAASVRAVSERHRRATTRTLRIAFLSSAALELVATIAVALVAVVAGLRLAAGGLDLRTALLAILLAPEAYWPVRRVGAEFHAAADGAAALAALLPRADGDRTLSGDPIMSGSAGQPFSGEASRTPAKPTPGLAHVTTTYDDRPAPVLDDVTIALPTGPALVAVTGPSGGGKTTLLEVLAELRAPQRGTVTVPPAHLVTQRPFLLPGTVRDALTLGAGRALPDAELEHALTRVGLTGALAERGGLDATIGDDGIGLSAGQRARLVLARAVLSEAPLLLLDEPTAHVDAATRSDLDAVVAGLARTRTVVAVTHRAGLATHATGHWVVADGRVTDPDGPPAADPRVAGATSRPGAATRPLAVTR
ncbi:ABC transporter transmembrane domain-containing protein [Lapillicoccus jejuensis]|uniref:ATP-binding cassette subfamily C protein CydD n=1 Tax=Lapillicoccus jejuensis TaxID=402171 RepID=A0A542DYL0_9MICO|nr:ABC transporter transmembrane domain-containing protein [Lapillicoccus jejuensis]TQJ08177.1 ATP-binding cassette subfamily C protein CydD [Lapillicoccus jejuensis]